MTARGDGATARRDGAARRGDDDGVKAVLYGTARSGHTYFYRECNVTGCDGIGVIRGGDFFYCEDHETESWDDDATTGDTT